MMAETITFNINDYKFSDDSLTISYKEKAYKKYQFEVTTDVVYQEFLFNGKYADAITISSYDSVLIKPDLDIAYFENPIPQIGIKFPRTPLNVGAKGFKRHAGFSILELNPFFVYNDSLFFISNVEFEFTNFKEQSYKYSKDQLYGKLDLLIITKNEFQDNFSIYMDFKIKQGYKTLIKTTEEIYLEYPGESEAIKIRNYIKDKYINNDLEYVIIGGGYSIVPVGKALPYVSDETGEIFTDSFYSKLDGDPDLNKNGVYFESADSPDYYEDVYVGRFPGNNEEEISAIINKNINYYSSERGFRASFNNSLFLLGMNVHQEGDGQYLCNNIKTEFSTETFILDSIYEEETTGFSKDTIMANFNRGYNFVYSQSHGDVHVIRQADYDFKIWSDDILNLSAVSGLYYIGACESGSIGQDSFSRKAMINHSGGCTTYIGSSGEEFTGNSYNFNAYFFRQINRNKDYGHSLADAKIVLGNISANGNGKYLSHTYLLQGDPSNRPFLKEPNNIGISSVSPFKKGNGSVSISLDTQPLDTLYVTLTDGENILSVKKTLSKDFVIDYENIILDSVYLNYYSQECFLTTIGYSTVPAEEISFNVEDITVTDENASGIVECGENFGFNFKFLLNSNPAGIDSLVAKVTGSSNSGISIINGQKRFRLPASGSYLNIGAFSINYFTAANEVPDSVAVTDLIITKKDGTVLYSDKIYVPYSVPYMKMRSYNISENTLHPEFINPKKGTINTAKIDLLEISRSGPSTDVLRSDIKSSVTLRKITGYKIVTDSVDFVIDSSKTYQFMITINGNKIYYSNEFGFNERIPEEIFLYADYSPGKIGIEWIDPFMDISGVNIYSSKDSSFTGASSKNFELVSGSEFSYEYEEDDPVYTKIAFVDSSGYEFCISKTVRTDPVGLYGGNTYKIAPFQLYNPVLVEGKLIANSQNSSIAGIYTNGVPINDSGMIHTAAVEGFSTEGRQGFAVGDVNSDGVLDMVNYSYSMGDSVLVKVVDLSDGTILAQRKIYGFIMENAPVLVNADSDSDLEILISVFKGELGGTPASGSYVYMLDYDQGVLNMVPGFPIYSFASNWTIHSPSLLDLNQDGSKELIFNCGTKIFVYNPLVPSKIIEYSLPKTIQTSLSYCDIDEDCDIEIFALTESYGTYGKLFCYNFNGSTLTEKSGTSGGLDVDMKVSGFYDLTPPVSFADIDDDGQTEIIVLTASKLYIYSKTFTNFGSFPVSLDPRVTTNNMSAPAIADLDGDSTLDVLFMDANNRIWCYSGASGSLLSGFPLKLNDIDRIEMTAPAVADLDGDGDLEFAFGVRDGVMVVYDYPAQTSGRPVFDNYRGDLQNSGLFQPLVPSSPENISINFTGSDAYISWDAVQNAVSYQIYSSSDPYGTFVYEGETTSTDYIVVNPAENKKFFYIKAVR